MRSADRRQTPHPLLLVRLPRLPGQGLRSLLSAFALATSALLAWANVALGFSLVLTAGPVF